MKILLGGDRISRDDNGDILIEKVPGVLINSIDKAEDNPNSKVLLIIDEINRGDVAGIFGETVRLLDREYSVNLPHPINGRQELSIPSNLYIIGTMNTSDRNIAFLDLALRRRFAFIDIQPNYEFLSEQIKLVYEGIEFNLGAILRNINNRIYQVYNDNTKLLGQSYFIPAEGDKWDKESFQNQFNFFILPTLQEYSFQDPSIVFAILGEELSLNIEDNEMFFRAFKDRYREMVI